VQLGNGLGVVESSKAPGCIPPSQPTQQGHVPCQLQLSLTCHHCVHTTPFLHLSHLSISYSFIIVALETTVCYTLYTHIYTYTHTHTHTHIYIHTYTHIYTHTYTHIHMYIRTYIYIYIYTHVCIYIYTYIHTYIHTCIHTHTHTYIHTHTSQAGLHANIHYNKWLVCFKSSGF
jgi:hypothetical protein